MSHTSLVSRWFCLIELDGGCGYVAWTVVMACLRKTCGDTGAIQQGALEDGDVPPYGLSESG